MKGSVWKEELRCLALKPLDLRLCCPLQGLNLRAECLRRRLRDEGPPLASGQEP